MSRNLIDEFYWSDLDFQKELSPEEKYKQITQWAGKARGQNPSVFDALTEWILDDSQWADDKLDENEQILMQGVFARFKEQNARLRELLKELEPSGVVNDAVFKALDRFDEELSGRLDAEWLSETVSKIFGDFSTMRDRSVREQIAGGITGPHGTDSVEAFGFINLLKDCDARVQWTLFMPDVVKEQQNGFKMDSFGVKNMPATRFIGKETREGSELATLEGRLKLFRTLDAMDERKSGFDYDVLFQHHYGRGVDAEDWHGFWGRFMKADTPVPDGFTEFDFVPENDGNAGLPYVSQFAFATFSGDVEAMHRDEGTDGGRLYDITRNTMLGQGINIPYPNKYWTAEVFLNGCDKHNTAYMFSAEL